jgi:hypothetical protein
MVDAGDPARDSLHVHRARANRATQPCAEGTPSWVPDRRGRGADLVEDLRVMLPRILSMDDDAPPYFARYSYGRAAGDPDNAVTAGNSVAPLRGWRQCRDSGSR